MIRVGYGAFLRVLKEGGISQGNLVSESLFGLFGYS